MTDIKNNAEIYRVPDGGAEPSTSHDVTEGGVIGTIGGAMVGALAGGPIGAVVGAIVGGAASAAAIDEVDKHDHDNIEAATGTAHPGNPEDTYMGADYRGVGTGRVP